MFREIISLLLHPFFLVGILIYSLSVFLLHFNFETPVEEPLFVAFIVGLIFSFTAWLFTKNISRKPERNTFRHEGLLICFLIVWITCYLTFGSNLINQMMPQAFLTNEKIKTFYIMAKKLVVFVLIPFLMYKKCGFSLGDFGFTKKIDLKNAVVFTVFTLLCILFQLYFSNSGERLKTHNYNVVQLITGGCITFFIVFIEAGLVEEFFFRTMLQSRLSVILKSPVAGIVLSTLIFGIIHAPGLYLRGAESEGITEQLPFYFFVFYCIAYMSVAGIFIGIIWQKTKNIWLIMAIHASMDLIPSLPQTIETFGIGK